MTHWGICESVMAGPKGQSPRGRYLPWGRMKNRFDEVMADQLFGKLPVPDTYQISNAWDDYGEFLLDKAKVKIINAEYSQERYGEPWDYGRLDLK